MHVIFLTARYPPDLLGGGEISTALTAEALAARGERVTVLAGAPEDRTEERNGVRLLRRRALSAWWAKPLREAKTARTAARAVGHILRALPQPPDLIHAQEFRSALSLAFLSHPRRIVTIRDYAPICGTTNNLWWNGEACDGCAWINVLFRCHRVVEASLPRKPARVLQYRGNLSLRLASYRAIPYHVYTSAFLRSKVTERLSLPTSVRTVVIPNPADPRFLSPPAVPLPLTPTVVSVGRLETTKGTDLLLSALSLVRQNIPEVRLNLVGGGEIARYRRLATAHGVSSAVSFEGLRSPEEVRQLLDASVVAVFVPRWEEPFGRIALEAGARARPLITVKRGGLREATTATTALYVSPGDVGALSRALLSLLRDRPRAERLGQAAREHVRAYYDPKRIAEDYAAFYGTIARGRSSDLSRETATS